jgi:hypothetical protein
MGLGFGAAAFLADSELDGEEEDAVSETADGLEDLVQPVSAIANDNRHNIPRKGERFIDFLRITRTFSEDTPICAEVKLGDWRGSEVAPALVPPQRDGASSL